MPIEGPIEDLGVGDLLQLVALSRRTGSFTASSADAADSFTIWIDEGAISGLSGSPEGLRLGRLAVMREGVAEEDVERALARQEHSPARRVGELLMEQGSLDESTIRGLLRFQIDEALVEMLGWHEGMLHFGDEPPRAAGALDIHLPIDGVLLDAARRLDELSEIFGGTAGDAIPTLADPGAGPREEMNLSAVDWETLAEVDGVSTLTAMARRLGRGKLEVARSLQRLHGAGVVNVAGGAERLHQPPRRSGLAEGSALFSQALAAYEAGDLVESRRQVGQALSENPRSAPAHTLAGVLAGRAGSAKEAVVHLRHAVEIDPLHESAYFHLAASLVRQGELDRACMEIETYLELAPEDHPLLERGRKLRAALLQTLDALGGAP